MLTHKNYKGYIIDLDGWMRPSGSIQVADGAFRRKATLRAD
jgi:hypothetical protein